MAAIVAFVIPERLSSSDSIATAQYSVLGMEFAPFVGLFPANYDIKKFNRSRTSSDVETYIAFQCIAILGITYDFFKVLTLHLNCIFA